uniref:Uncharacterized protein n=1 Tax=Hyaloperonospora arabidopsidis (strain Emoy2) TaxID=559515 RepID=M4BIH6_HYAAE
MSAASRRGISASAKRMSEEGEHHQHLLFEGDYSKSFVIGMTLFVTLGELETRVPAELMWDTQRTWTTKQTRHLWSWKQNRVQG